MNRFDKVKDIVHTNSNIGINVGAGRKRIVELICEQFDRLSNAGYAVFWIGHTKEKTKEDVLTGVSYEIVTNNLEDNFFNALEARSQMVMNFVAERDFTDVSSETSKGFDGKTTTKEIGTLNNVTRYIYFRDSGLVHASCNFPDVPTKAELSVDNFLKVFNDGVTASRLSNVSKEQIARQEKKEEELNAVKVKALQNKEETSDSAEKDEIIAEIKTVLKSKATIEGVKEQVIQKITDLKINPKSYSESKLSSLKEFLTFVNSL